MLILTLSVICEKDGETYSIPLKIRISTMDTRITICPDVYLFYDQSR